MPSRIYNIVDLFPRFIIFFLTALWYLANKENDDLWPLISVCFDTYLEVIIMQPTNFRMNLNLNVYLL